MEKKRVIRLTFALYKITEGLQEKEPLKIVLREKALDVLVNTVLLSKNPSFTLDKVGQEAIMKAVLMDIKGLSACLELAQDLEWLNKEYLLVLLSEYSQLKQETAEFQNKYSQPASSSQPTALVRPVLFSQPAISSQLIAKEKKAPPLDNLQKPRHKKIIKILQEKNTAQVKDFEKHFPQLTKRTLRRDMNYLLSRGFIKRQGDKSNTYYRLK